MHPWGLGGLTTTFFFGHPNSLALSSNSLNLETNLKEAVKVTVAKDVELKTDFFSDPKRLESDGLEEKVILYRIEKEISVERALQRAQKKLNKN